MDQPDAWLYIRDQLNAGTYSRLKLHEVLESRLENVDLPYRGWGSDRGEICPTEIGLPSRAEDPTLSYVHIEDTVDDIHVTQVRELSSGELLIEVDVDAEVQFDFFVFKSNWWGMNEEEEDFWVVDPDWNEG